MQLGDLIHTVKEFDRIQTRIDRIEEKCGGDIEGLSQSMKKEHSSLSQKAEQLRKDVLAEHGHATQIETDRRGELESFEGFAKHHPFASWLWMWVGGILFVITGYDKKMKE